VARQNNTRNATQQHDGAAVNANANFNGNGNEQKFNIEDNRTLSP
jgi:hypothetical protein